MKKCFVLCLCIFITMLWSCNGKKTTEVPKDVVEEQPAKPTRYAVSVADVAVHSLLTNAASGPKVDAKLVRNILAMREMDAKLNGAALANPSAMILSFSPNICCPCKQLLQDSLLSRSTTLDTAVKAPKASKVSPLSTCCPCPEKLSLMAMEAWDANIKLTPTKGKSAPSELVRTSEDGFHYFSIDPSNSEDGDYVLVISGKFDQPEFHLNVKVADKKLILAP